MAAIRIDPAWEQIRAKHRDMYFNAQNRYQNQHSFEPGQIASCKGSLNVSFYRYLSNMGVNLEASEMRSMTVDEVEMPTRYCVVNRRIHDQIYEVFLVTSFRGAKNIDDLGRLGRDFGMPMGNTKWFNDTPGLTVIPPVLGVERSSFVFAIPAIQSIEASLYMPFATRMPSGELDRLRNFSRTKLGMLQEKHEALRKELKHYNRDKRAYADNQNDFKPIPRRMPISMEDHDDMQHFIPNSAIISSSRFKPKRLKYPDYNNISWPLRHVAKDLNISKSLSHLSKRPVGNRSFSLPKPYYAPRLPISLKKVWRSIL